MKFSQELQKRREEKGLTLRDAAQRIGFSFSQLWNYEHGMRVLQMSMEHARAISKFYGWDLGEMGKKIGKEAGESWLELHGEETKTKTKR